MPKEAPLIRKDFIDPLNWQNNDFCNEGLTMKESRHIIQNYYNELPKDVQSFVDTAIERLVTVIKKNGKSDG